MKHAIPAALQGPRHCRSLKNPAMTASGTFGRGLAFQHGGLASLGGIAVKGLSLQLRPGGPTPRGMRGAAGLWNGTAASFARERLDELRGQLKA